MCNSGKCQPAGQRTEDLGGVAIGEVGRVADAGRDGIGPDERVGKEGTKRSLRRGTDRT